MNDLTRILNATAHGEPAAVRLLPLVYDELRQLAARKMASESGTQTLQPTALVNEAWLRLGGDEQPTWETAHISFAPRPKLCDASSLTAPGASKPSGTAEGRNASRLKKSKLLRR